jgi:hypothetical protein
MLLLQKLDVIADSFQPQTRSSVSTQRLHFQRLMLEGLIKVIQALVGRAEAAASKQNQDPGLEQLVSNRQKTLSRALLLLCRTKLEFAILSDIGEELLTMDISDTLRQRRRLLAQVTSFQNETRNALLGPLIS